MWCLFVNYQRRKWKRFHDESSFLNLTLLVWSFHFVVAMKIRYFQLGSVYKRDCLKRVLCASLVKEGAPCLSEEIDWEMEQVSRVSCVGCPVWYQGGSYPKVYWVDFNSYRDSKIGVSLGPSRVHTRCIQHLVCMGAKWVPRGSGVWVSLTSLTIE